MVRVFTGSIRFLQIDVFIPIKWFSGNALVMMSKNLIGVRVMHDFHIFLLYFQLSCIKDKSL